MKKPSVLAKSRTAGVMNIDEKGEKRQINDKEMLKLLKSIKQNAQTKNKRVELLVKKSD